MTLPINPYVAGNPVGDSPAFVGRADVLRRAQDNAIVLYGQRRIGKTSILQHLAVRGEDVAELQGQLRVEVEGREKAEAEAIREADIRLWRKWKLERLQAELDAERNAGESLEGDRPLLGDPGGSWGVVSARYWGGGGSSGGDKDGGWVKHEGHEKREHEGHEEHKGHENLSCPFVGFVIQGLEEGET